MGPYSNAQRALSEGSMRRACMITSRSTNVVCCLQKLYEPNVGASVLWELVKQIMLGVGPGDGSRQEGNILVLLVASRGSNAMHRDLNVSPISFGADVQIPQR